LLKKVFEPKYNSRENYDIYFSLIYGPQCENKNEEKTNSSINESNKILSGGLWHIGNMFITNFDKECRYPKKKKETK
ncbi:36758_t:CDS:1, partial [Racocetra persica]